MSNPDVRVLQIKKINFEGKWVEFWFYNPDTHNFDQSCKAYMLHEVDYTPKGYIDNNGYKDLFVVWPVGSDRPVALFAGEDNRGELDG